MLAALPRAEGLTEAFKAEVSRQADEAEAAEALQMANSCDGEGDEDTTHPPQVKKAEVDALFNILDSDTDNHLSPQELRPLAKEMGIYKGDSNAQWQTFYAGWCKRHEVSDTAKGVDRTLFEHGLLEDPDVAGVGALAQSVFKVLDINSNHHLGQGEFLPVATTLGMFTGSIDDWPQAYVAHCKANDVDPNEGIDVQDFKRALCRHASQGNHIA